MSDEKKTDIEELKTDPFGLKPPPDIPHDIFDDAPPWARVLITDIHALRVEVFHLRKDQYLQKLQHRSMEKEFRGHLENHDLAIIELQEADAELSRRVTDLEQHIGGEASG